MTDPRPTALQSAERRELILRAAVREGLLDPEDALLAGFIDFDAVAATVAALHRAFPEQVEVLHAFAAKANSLVPVLEELRGLGMGCEVASPGEFAQALAAGFDPARIVFDSPAKTRRELRQALDLGAAVNIDNWQELARVDELLADKAENGTPEPRSRIGVRINPQVGGGSIGAMSTATATSKFGITLADEGNAERLVAAFRERPWLTWLHCHVGSQGCPLDLMAKGVAAAVAFAQEINRELGRRQVVGLDIGGGLPVDFSGDLGGPGYEEYVERLRIHAPALFSGEFQLVTEFGRSVLAKSGFTAGYVEYTKNSGGRAIAITSAGVQVATRTVFAPEAWPLRISTHDATGAEKHGEPVEQDIAGPACFAGDLVARARPLPLLEPGDIVALLDTGAYYASTPFNYNSLLEPAVHGARVAADGTVRFSLLRRAQTVEELLARTGG
ncbi:diaminopimelate decarboxylase [Kitasatospora herbaricolor]|uniref:diaminopimelate decarboxylase n=1 Tax=Kitasatospora herbaricolor TaxID=68217 RepID=UPI001747E0EA|nr:diaminopimelate decarboxylase [Kitasatospora herbaricolor]MDQ0308050.1 diaminopimelate decarboxylase [Kitasatospora herbaricolor]GGV05097.1 diaminopimelate decarboxylase [Kitasatospora herbaricolor]